MLPGRSQLLAREASTTSEKPVATSTTLWVSMYFPIQACCRESSKGTICWTSVTLPKLRMKAGLSMMTRCDPGSLTKAG